MGTEDDEDLTRCLDRLGDFWSQGVTAAQVTGIHLDRDTLSFESEA